MRVTTKGRMALSALLDLSAHQHKGPVTLIAISARKSVSLSYLEQLFRLLRIAGLVQSVRGPGGGYLLTRPLSAITAGQVMAAVDGDESDDGISLPAAQAASPEHRVAAELWKRLHGHVYGFLDQITLDQLARGEFDLADLGEVPFAPPRARAERALQL